MGRSAEYWMEHCRSLQEYEDDYDTYMYYHRSEEEQERYELEEAERQRALNEDE